MNLLNSSKALSFRWLWSRIAMPSSVISGLLRCGAKRDPTHNFDTVGTSAAASDGAKQLDRHGFHLFSSLLRKGGCFAGIQKLLGVEPTEKLDQLCDHAGPSGLMAGSEARSVIAMEVLEEQDVVLPLGVGLE